MALFPSVIPWTLVLTQVMTAGLAVVPGRWAHLFRKCLQVQVLCGWERARGTQRPCLPFPFGSGSLRRQKKKREHLPSHFSKIGEGKQECSRSGANVLLRLPSYFFCPLTCTCEHSAKICMGGWSRSILVMPRSQLKSSCTDCLEQAPSLVKKEKTRNTAWLHR